LNDGIFVSRLPAESLLVLVPGRRGTLSACTAEDIRAWWSWQQSRPRFRSSDHGQPWLPPRWSNRV